MQEEIVTLLAVAKVLSGVLLVVVLLAMVNVWRRPSLPVFSYGTITPSVRRMRWIWFLALLGALAQGISEEPVAVLTNEMEDPEALATVESTRETSLEYALLFYSYARERTYGDGALLAERVTEGLVIPRAVLSALLLYLILVVRWNPEGRWARRILYGRRWRKVVREQQSEE